MDSPMPSFDSVTSASFRTNTGIRDAQIPRLSFMVQSNQSCAMVSSAIKAPLESISSGIVRPK